MASPEYGTFKLRECNFCRRIYDSTQKDATPMMKCGACGFARYCNKECQRRDWKQHKPFCEKLQKHAKNYNVLDLEHPINKKIKIITKFIASNMEARIALFAGSKKFNPYSIILEVDELDKSLEIIKKEKFPIDTYAKTGRLIPSKQIISLPFTAQQDQNLVNKEAFDLLVAHELRDIGQRDEYKKEDLFAVNVMINVSNITIGDFVLMIPNFVYGFLEQTKIKIKVDEFCNQYLMMLENLNKK